MVPSVTLLSSQVTVSRKESKRSDLLRRCCDWYTLPSFLVLNNLFFSLQSDSIHGLPRLTSSSFLNCLKTMITHHLSLLFSSLDHQDCFWLLSHLFCLWSFSLSWLLILSESFVSSIHSPLDCLQFSLKHPLLSQLFLIPFHCYWYTFPWDEGKEYDMNSMRDPSFSSEDPDVMWCLTPTEKTACDHRKEVWIKWKKDRQ